MEGLVGFADVGYLSDPHNGRSQMGYVFMCGGASISWHSMKQTIAATSSNHVEILAIHEASRECLVEKYDTSYSQGMQFIFIKGSTNGYT